MPEGVDATTKVVEQGQRRRYPNLEFYPAVHRSDDGGRMTVLSDIWPSLNRRLTAGDFDAHIWTNSELLPLLNEKQPKILFIDGLMPERNRGESDPEKLYTISPEKVWISLPGMPSEINRTGKVWIVSGDSFDPDIGYGVTDDGVLAGALVRKMDSDYENIQKEHLMEMVKLLSVAGFTSGLVGVGVAEAVKKRQEGKPLLQRTARRRSVLGGIFAGLVSAAGLGGVGAFGQSAGQQLSASASSDRMKDFWLAVSDKIRIPAFDSDILQARTAMGFMKLKDAADFMSENDPDNFSSETAGGSIAGLSHARGADTLLNSDGLCLAAVKKYAMAFLPVLDEALKYSPSLNREECIRRIKEYLTVTVISEVTDPKPVTATKTGIDSVAEAVSTVAVFPSKRVAAALADFK